MTRRIEWNGGYGAPEESMKRRRVASEVVARGGSYVQSGGPVYTRRCYVGNLAWHISWQELKDAFRPCGNIVYANVTREDDGRSAGWGIVEFETPAEAANAIQMMNNVDLGGRPLLVREDREDRETKGMGGPPPVAASPRYERVRVGRDAPPPSYRAAAPVVQYSGGGGGGSRRCYVGNLAWQTAWQDLKDAFRCCGNIVYANVTKESDGRSAGWGIVEFETAAEAAQAIATMNNVDLGGRMIHVREDREDREVKGGSHSGGGYGGGAPAAPAFSMGAHPAAYHGGSGYGRGASAPAPAAGGCSRLQLVVQGLPFAYTWKELKDLFAGVGDVDRADVMIGSDGRSKGWGVVRFTNAAAAQRGIGRWDKRELEGRTLAVFLDKFA